MKSTIVLEGQHSVEYVVGSGTRQIHKSLGNGINTCYRVLVNVGHVDFSSLSG